jgi:uncharacterized protein YdhG (YjbR/CyaY superfamily)
VLYGYNVDSIEKAASLLFNAGYSHIGIYPGGEATAVFAARLTGYKTSKGAIQFPLDRAPDFALIADIMRWRVEQVQMKKENR